MVIEAYNFAKEPNSTKIPSTSGRSITCRLKDNVSLMHPVFLLESYQMTDNYIKWGSRYYWIDDIVIVNNSMAEYHCRQDVLASFRSYIGSSSQYIIRSAHAYSPAIIDTIYPVTSSKILVETELSTLAERVFPSNGGFFVIGVQNGETIASGGITYYALTNSEFKSLLDYMYAGTWLDTTEANITIAIQKELINPMQYISSIIWYPFSTSLLNNYTSVSSIKFGWWTASGLSGKVIPSGAFIESFTELVSLPRHPQAASRGTYLNGAPYTRYTLFCYSFGEIPLDPGDFITSGSCVVMITVDLSTGDASLNVLEGSAGSDPKLVLKVPGKMGQPLQISQLNQSLISPVMNVVSGSVGMGYGNVVGFGQGIISAIESMMPQVERSGSTGSRMWFYKKPTLLTEQSLLADEDRAHLGRPLCTRGIISNYPGYVRVENADIDFACNYAELSEIKSAMESGFYYE